MAVNTDAATETLADTETYMKAGAGLAGYMGGTVAENLTESRFDAPDELYGIAVILVAALLDVPYKEAVMVGGGVHTAEAAAERAGVRSTIANVGKGV